MCPKNRFETLRRHTDNTERLKAMETLDSSLNLAQIEWKK